MKIISLFVATLFCQMTMAADFPELYCVSTKSFEGVNQINLFTNDKGTMRINLQFFATDGENAGNFDTDYLHTVTRLQYDSESGVISNKTDKLELQVEKKSISPKKAQELMGQVPYLDIFNLPGHKVDFKRYYVAEMTAYNLPGKKGEWTETLMQAYKAGVTKYICGNAEDIIN